MSPSYPTAATSDERRFLQAYRDLPSDNDRRVFLDHMLSYDRGEITFEQAGLGFLLGTGLSEAEAQTWLDEAKAAHPDAGWGDRGGGEA